jgi:hypothetical protein
MAVGIECPICEAEFLVKRVGPKLAIRCPDCQRKFLYCEDVLVDPASSPNSSGDPSTSPKATSELNPLPKTPAADFAAPSEAPPKLATPAPPKMTAATPAVDSQSPRQVKTDLNDGPSTAGKQSSVVSEIREAYNQRSQRQKLVSIVGGAAGLVAICVLSVVLYRQLNAKDTKQAASPAPPNATTQSKATTQSDSSKLNAGQGNQVSAQPDSMLRSDEPNQTQPSSTTVQGDDQPDSPEEQIAAADLPEREFDYFSKRELELIWERVRPRLLSLSVRTDQGNLPAVGTIIDSRGWALTSYQLAGKWPEVAVTSSATNLDAYNEHVNALSGQNPKGQKLLTDQSKGLAGQAPKLDLALLAVNLRFVVALDKFEILPRTKIVAGLFLAQAGPPSFENPYGVEEIEVLAKQSYDELESLARNKADELGLTDPTIDWVVTNKKARPVPGTPALDRSGGLAARYVFSTRYYAYFLPADDALSAVQLASNSGNGKPTQPNAPDTQLLPIDHSMARPNELMNRSGSACEQFGWLPTDNDEYLELQKFSRRISTVQKFIRDNQNKESESIVLSILSNHITRWQKSLSRSLGNSKIFTDQSIDQLNQFALKQLNRRKLTTGSSYIPFFAEVYSAGIDENNLDSILLQLGDQDAFIRVPFDGRNTLRPGSRWLCFFKRDTRLVKRKLKLNSGESAPLFTGKLSLVLGPFK